MGIMQRRFTRTAVVTVAGVLMSALLVTPTLANPLEPAGDEEGLSALSMLSPEGEPVISDEMIDAPVEPATVDEPVVPEDLEGTSAATEPTAVPLEVAEPLTADHGTVEPTVTSLPTAEVSQTIEIGETLTAPPSPKASHGKPTGLPLR